MTGTVFYSVAFPWQDLGSTLLERETLRTLQLQLLCCVLACLLSQARGVLVELSWNRSSGLVSPLLQRPLADWENEWS